MRKEPSASESSEGASWVFFGLLALVVLLVLTEGHAELENALEIVILWPRL